VQPGRAAGDLNGKADTPLVMGDVMPGGGHPEMLPADGCELVRFRPDMRTHMLHNVRDRMDITPNDTPSSI
jgi:hypothetical protein